MTHTQTHTHTHTHTHSLTHTHKNTHAHTRTHTHSHTHTQTHTHKHSRTHTQTHTHTHSRTQPALFERQEITWGPGKFLILELNFVGGSAVRCNPMTTIEQAVCTGVRNLRACTQGFPTPYAAVGGTGGLNGSGADGRA